MAQLVPGATLHGYRIEALLGEGGMGSVHRAVHEASGRVIALKSMKPAAAENADYRRRFRREARAAMAVRHPNVVTVHEVFENDGVPYIAMELLEGMSLEQRLGRDGSLPLRTAARMMVRVTSAVGTAHAMGIVHRDLKPDNIFLVGSGPDPEVKVLDFGIAKLTAVDGEAAQTAALTRTGMLMGTPFYMSPEQAFGEKSVDQRTDIWAVGIILYRILTGVLPTRADGFGEVFRLVVQGDLKPLTDLAPSVPRDLADLVESMLRKSRDDRPWDLTEAHQILLRHAEADEVEVPSFGMAVAPLFDDLSANTDVEAATSIGGSREPLAVTPGGSKPLAMTPGSLRRATPARPSSPEQTVAFPSPASAQPAPSPRDDGAATLVYSPPSPPSPPSSSVASTPVPTRRSPGLALAILVLLAAAIVVALRSAGLV